jgi:hypothetical protein
MEAEFASQEPPPCLSFDALRRQGAGSTGMRWVYPVIVAQVCVLAGVDAGLAGSRVAVICSGACVKDEHPASHNAIAPAPRDFRYMMIVRC